MAGRIKKQITLEQEAEERGEETRRFGRRRQEALLCDCGLVMDLSAGGMRVQSRRVPEEKTLEVTIQSEAGDLTLTARVVWSRRAGFRRREFGLEFVDVDDETRRQLTTISSLHRANLADSRAA